MVCIESACAGRRDISLHTKHTTGPLKQPVGFVAAVLFPFVEPVDLGRLRAFLSPDWWEEVGSSLVTLMSNTCASLCFFREEGHCRKRFAELQGRRFLLLSPQLCLMFKVL